MENQSPHHEPDPLIPASPEVPLTLEGAAVLHQMMRVRWSAWKALEPRTRAAILGEAAAVIEAMESTEGGGSAAFSLFGHKGDLMFVHFRRSFGDLAAVERQLTGLRLYDFLEAATSYVSVVELGLYESSGKLYASLGERGVPPGSDEWAAAVAEALERQRTAMAPRLYPEVPSHRYICFYPMDRKRGESKNWYSLPLPDRQRMMREHGQVGRKYAGVVKQIISGSIGLDDWEWGVDLFADDPVVFKKLIYEMRFDEVSAAYAAFGPFYVGLRVPAAELASCLSVGPGPVAGATGVSA